ncbi:Tim44/TimA family putative adaptor protein [Gluconobacter sp. LMG 31484]|uniref:Tim44/TimA family putative adaptor protein n=1 Tax=Gluconobacter vitians TaxID=2728102 RepID=A0ABR9Y1I6_9PROT|nr:Tim44/TimA family putative adaptor protein [Gluconobacter vitians]MBF0857805.1 Tim44/TimA family putative adaptor protein [Gluconobacter vitians]
MSSSDIHLPAGLMDHAGHHFPWDLVVLFVLAVALGVRLYRVLGRRVGMQGVRQERPGAGRFGPGAKNGAAPDASRPSAPPPLPGKASGGQGDANGALNAAAAPEVDYEIPAPATRVGTVLGEIASVFPGFSPSGFLKDAEDTFRQVVPAFAVGDRAVLQKLLTPVSMESFSAAIDAREQAGETQRSDLRGVESLSILDAMIVSAEDGARTGRIEVKIVSRQVNILTDRAGEPVVGTEAVTEFHDLWLFERVVGQSDARWRLAASRPA